MADYGTFKYGGATYPLPSSTANQLLLDADPSLYYVLDYFQSVLNTHMSARLLAECAKSPVIAAVTSAVMAVCPYDPTPFLQEQQFRFPLLAVYRKKDKYIWKTIGVWDDASEWCVDYILPPVTGGQMERINPILRSTGVILRNRIETKMDPSYQAGIDIWAKANLEEITLDEASYGGFAGTGNQMFPAWRGKLIVKECDSFVGVDASLQVFAGTDNETDIIATLPADGTLSINFQNTVGAGVVISPLNVTVIRSTSTTFTATGGSLSGVVFTLLSNNSGGSINSSTGVYTAGPTFGVWDVVGVQDSVSHGITNALIQVI